MSNIKANSAGSTPSRHVLVAYTWSVNNVGDVAIVPGLLNLIRQSQPELPIRVITSQIEGSGDYNYFQDYLESNFADCRTLGNPFKPVMGEPRYGDDRSAWGRFCDRWGQHKLEAFAKGSLATDAAVGIARDLLDRFPRELVADWEQENPAALEAYLNAGFVLYASGTTFNFGRLQVRDFWTYALHFAMPLIIARHLRIPYGISAQSFDAIDWPGDLAFRPLFKDAAFIFSRDSDSAAYLRQRDLDNEVGGYRPDSSFFYHVQDEAWAQQYLAEKKLEDCRFLVLITRHATPAISAESSAWDKVGADPTAGTVSQERQERQMQKLRDFIEAWVEKTGMPILMALETRAAQQPMREWLDRDLSPRARAACVWLEEFWSTEQAYSVYKRARIVVSMEMHSVIMAIQAQTPTILIPFREAGRKARMLQDVGLGDWLLDIDEMPDDALLETCLKIDQNFEASVERTKVATGFVEKLAKDMIERVTNSFEA